MRVEFRLSVRSQGMDLEGQKNKSKLHAEVIHHLIQSLCIDMLRKDGTLFKASCASIHHLPKKNLKLWTLSNQANLKVVCKKNSKRKFDDAWGKSEYIILCKYITNTQIIRTMTTFFSGRPSFSGTISCIATSTSAGVKAGPEWAEPCNKHLNC